MCGKIAEPPKWGTPRIVFVNSMSDLFHEGVPEGFISQVCQVMRKVDLACSPTMVASVSGTSPAET